MTFNKRLLWIAYGTSLMACAFGAGCAWIVGPPGELHTAPADAGRIDTGLADAPADLGDADASPELETGAPGGACHVCPEGRVCTDAHCGSIRALALGYTDACVVKVDGSLWCWGASGSGQLGYRAGSDASCAHGACRPDRVKIPIDDVATVAVGYEVLCAIKGDGTVWCWGWNNVGQLGHDQAIDGMCGAYQCNEVPHAVSGFPSGTRIVQLTIGSSQVCARSSAGDIYCWGENRSGAIGAPLTTASSTTPVKVPGFAGDAIDVALGYTNFTGDGHACAVKADGSVWCWGANAYGQLGHLPGAPDPDCGGNCSHMPTQVVSGAGTSLGGMTHVQAGFKVSCAQAATSRLTCWGSNADSILGDPRFACGTDAPALPTLVAGLPSTIGDLTTKFTSQFVVDGNGSALGWGWNLEGTLGSGNADGVTCGDGIDVTTPSPSASLTGISWISAGFGNGMAIKKDGAVLVWGQNTEAILGHVSNTDGDISPDAGNPYNASPVMLWREQL